jgi:putative lipoprotein
VNPKLALIFVLHAPTLPPDNWLGVDKLKHFMMSAFAESAAYAGLRSTGVEHGPALAAAAGATIALGVGREIHDRRVYGRFSVRDLTWDAIGAAAALPLLNKSQR